MASPTTIIDRIGAMSGLAFVGFAFAAFTQSGASDPPSPDEASARLAAYLIESGANSRLITTLMLLSVFCLIFFIAFLAHQIWHAGDAGGWLALVTLGGGLVFAAMLLVMTAVTIATKVVSDYGDDTQVAKTLYVIGWDFVFVFGPPLAASIGAASLAAVLMGVLPSWLGWAGLLVTLLLVVPQLAWGGLLLAFPWLAVASLILSLRTEMVQPNRTAMKGL